MEVRVLDPRLATSLLIALAMLVLFCLLALAVGGAAGVLAAAGAVTALARFVRAWFGPGKKDA